EMSLSLGASRVLIMWDEYSHERPWRAVGAAAAGTAAGAGRAAGRRAAGAGRVADRAATAVRQGWLPVLGRGAARPVCLLHPAPGWPRPGEVRAGRASRRGAPLAAARR